MKVVLFQYLSKNLAHCFIVLYSLLFKFSQGLDSISWIGKFT